MEFENLARLACNVFELKREELFSKNRNRQIAYKRLLVVYSIYQLGIFSMPQIANFLKRKEHTFVLHAKKRALELIENDISLKTKFDLFNKKVNSKTFAIENTADAYQSIIDKLKEEKEKLLKKEEKHRLELNYYQDVKFSYNSKRYEKRYNIKTTQQYSINPSSAEFV